MGRRSYFTSLILIILCLIALTDSSALFVPYLLAALYSVYCLYTIRDITCEKGRRIRIINIASIISALFIALANHKLYLENSLPEVAGPYFTVVYRALIFAVIMAGVFVCARSVLIRAVYDRRSFSTQSDTKRTRYYTFFLIPFAILAIIYLIVYFCCYYPALITVDTVDQIDQIFSGVYSNHQPFYHTILLGVLIRTGMSMFGNINSGVSFAAVFQIFFMAATFAFVIYNMAKLTLASWMCALATAWYALMPFHIMYSYTLWKDVYFGAFVTCLIIFFIRIEKKIGGAVINYIAFALCSLLICLIRSNGLFSYVFVLIFALLLMRHELRLIITMFAVIVAAFVLKHSVLSALNVTQPDTVEALSMPIQQIARVVAEEGNITPRDRALLSEVIDVERIADEYDPGISDPIKQLIRDFGNQDYITENKGEYALLYLRTFVRNPLKYVLAWVDGTCGYWNSGYNYWVWYWDVENNDHGITRIVGSEGMLHFMDDYLWLFYNNRVLQVFTAMGFFVWILLLVLAVNISDDNRCGIIACVPVFAILLSLLISSPVFSEFRYMYALFCALPVIIAISLRRGENAKGEKR